MSKRFIKNRKARYGTMTVVLTVLLIATVVLVNVLFTSLAKRYLWVVDMKPTPDYSVTDTCFQLLDGVLKTSDSKVQIIFCDTQGNLEKEITSKYVLETARAMSGRFSDRIELEFHNIWLDPASVKDYSSALNPETGEQIPTKLKSTSIIIKCGDYYRAYDLVEFFTFEDGDRSKLWAYNGEKKLAAGILHALEPDSPVACLTNNHGEIFYDFELLMLLDDAGYTIRYVDIFTKEIPDNCKLLITYNPNSDLIVSDGVSSRSEVDILENYLSKSGNAYLVFLENGTPSLPNLEGFLGGWGVETRYHTSKSSDRSYRYMVQSPSSLTSDGYTIYGHPATEGRAAELVSGLKRETVFKNATALRAANGFADNGDGSYTKDNRTVYSVFTAGKDAISWANGAPVDDSEATLFTVTEQKNGESGSSFVGVCASVDFATEEFLQSAVHGNTDTLMHFMAKFGKTNTPEGLVIKPFESTAISSVTTAQMWQWTLALSVIPAITVTAVALAVLLKRRRA